MDNNKVHSLIEKFLIENAKLDPGKKCFEGQDAETFEKILSLQDEILDTFGLSYSNYHYETLNQVLKSGNIVETIKELQEKAKEYLTLTPSSDLKLLQNSRKFKYEPDYILSELKVLPHIYTYFICSKLLTDTPESEILQEFNIIRNNDKLLNDIGILVFDSGINYKNHPKFDSISNSGLKYLIEFITQEKWKNYKNQHLN